MCKNIWCSLAGKVSIQALKSCSKHTNLCILSAMNTQCCFLHAAHTRTSILNSLLWQLLWIVPDRLQSFALLSNSYLHYLTVLLHSTCLIIASRSVWRNSFCIAIRYCTNFLSQKAPLTVSIDICSARIHMFAVSATPSFLKQLKHIAQLPCVRLCSQNLKRCPCLHRAVLHVKGSFALLAVVYLEVERPLIIRVILSSLTRKLIRIS